MAGLLKAFPPPKGQLVNLTKAARAVNIDLVKGFNQARYNKAQAGVFTAGYQLGFQCMHGYLAVTGFGKAFKYGWTVSGCSCVIGLIGSQMTHCMIVQRGQGCCAIRSKGLPQRCG
jgi:hypothetical protein